MIHGYKKNGWLYRTWEFPKILEINDEYICVYIKDSIVKNSEKFSKRNFLSKNQKDSFWFFVKDKWFNIVATIYNEKVSYYINLSSPFIFEEEAIKYIDFDIDIRMDHMGNMKLLDEKEFDMHKIEFNYGKKLSNIIEIESKKILDKKFAKELIKTINYDFLKELNKRIENE